MISRAILRGAHLGDALRDRARCGPSGNEARQAASSSS